MAYLDGLLEIEFLFSPVAGIFDLIVASTATGILGDFDTVNITGLAPGTLYSAGTVVENGNAIYRLQIGTGGLGPVSTPGTLLWMLAGLGALLRRRRRSP